MSRQQNFDPFGSIEGFMNSAQHFAQNPMQFVAQKGLNIPNEYANDPAKANQYLLDSGQVTQEQYNWVQGQVQKIQRNPLLRRFFGF